MESERLSRGTSSGCYPITWVLPLIPVVFRRWSRSPSVA